MRDGPARCYLGGISSTPLEAPPRATGRNLWPGRSSPAPPTRDGRSLAGCIRGPTPLAVPAPNRGRGARAGRKGLRCRCRAPRATWRSSRTTDAQPTTSLDRTATWPKRAGLAPKRAAFSCAPVRVHWSAARSYSASWWTKATTAGTSAGSMGRTIGSKELIAQLCSETGTMRPR